MEPATRRALLGGAGAVGVSLLTPGCAGVFGSAGASMTEDWEAYVSRTTGGIAARGGTVYVGTRDGLTTVDVETGDGGWDFSVGRGNVSSRPVVEGGTVFFGTLPRGDSQARLYAVTVDGDEAWSEPLPGGVSTAGVTDGTVVAASGVMRGEDGLYAFDAETGDREWGVSFDTHPVGSSPVAAGGTVFLESDGFAAFDAGSGDLVWREEREGPAIGGAARHAPAVGDGTVYFSHPAEPAVYAFDAATGDEEWTAEVNARASQPVLDGNTLYVGTDGGSPDDPDGRLYALDAATGDERWSVHTGNAPLEEPVVRDGTVYTAGFDTLYAVDDGEITWEHGFENGISAPVAAGDRLLLDTPTSGSSGHTLYALV